MASKSSLFDKLFNKSDKKQAAEFNKQKDAIRQKRSPVALNGNVLTDIKENILLGEDEDGKRKDDGKMPSAEEINIKFEKLMKYRGISANDRRRKALNAKSMEEKWKLIQIHQKTMFEQENSFKITGAPEYYVHVLKEAPTKEGIQELCKMLKTKPEEWIKKFLGKSSEHPILFNTPQILMVSV
ncbi:forD [Acrasis kona]|uniref:ForD n=1 Tax=Acrasis kona TaxID=1008807 RepID=A0AAW2Z7P3_9EUKA